MVILHEVILSAGIDIGTSTTQLIFSRLTLENRAVSYMAPQIDIVDKEVVYRSPIYFTPLKSPTEIDAEAVKDIVRREYAAGGMSPKDIQTGAVIITGETARKQNANEVLAALSDMAGDFVVATAGPDLESVLSARGAGADALSKQRRVAVANLDVGGGTSNIHTAMEKGEFDLYPEYTSSGWVMVLKHEAGSVGDDEILAQLQKEYQENFGMTWVGLYGFNNTYTVAVRGEAAALHNRVLPTRITGVEDGLLLGELAER